MTEEVNAILSYPEKGQLLVVTCSGQINTFEQDSSSRIWKLLTQIRLPGAAADSNKGLHVAWAEGHTLAAVSEKEMLIRLFNFDTEDNYVLSIAAALQSTSAAAESSAGPSCLAYDIRHDELAVGLKGGKVLTFRRRLLESEAEVLDLSKTWEAQAPFQVAGEPSRISWGPIPQLLSVAVTGTVHICRRVLLQQCVNGEWAVMQVAANSVVVEALGAAARSLGKVRTSLQILGLDVNKETLLLWDGKIAELHRLGMTEASQIAQFDSTSTSMALHGDTVYRAMENRVEAVTFSGTVKQTLAFEEELGRPIHVHVNGNYLAVCTHLGQLKIFRLAGREARPHAGPSSILPQDDADFGQTQDQDPPLPSIASIRMNCTGQLVGAVLGTADGGPDGRITVFSTESNSVHTYDFGAEQRIPQIMCWDAQEPKLLAVQTKMKPSVEGSDGITPAPSTSEIAILFAAPEHGVILQEYQKLEGASPGGLAAVTAPYLMLNKPRGTATDVEGQVYASRMLLQSFAGMESVDEDTRKALLAFSFHLAVGDMEEAFRSVKAIRNPSVWRNLALLSIKRRNLDIAEHCLGHLEHVRGARAVREARDIEELDARVATVAVHLGLVDEAHRLYSACGRYDLLGQLCRASGQWDKALDIAEKHDRIHLKPTHYAYARHMEQMRDFKKATSHYEKANAAQQEVPRMLYEAGRLDELERYVHKTGHKELAQWWARYCESNGDLSRAAGCYKAAGDHLALVRLHVHSGNWRAAEAAALESRDPAAAFHLARQYEAQEKVSEAIRFYALAQRHSHGVRLAKQYELDSDLLSLALKSTKPAMLEAADYLAERGQADKAATLYLKAGRLRQAVDMCFEGQLFDVLQQVADELHEDSDPVLLAKCAEFFLQHGQHAKAAKILSAARDPSLASRAVDLCLQHDVPITEEMAEALTPDKGALPAEERSALLMKIAKAAKHQGQWHLAAKKFTQAGDKMRAMKALVKSGDTEKITFFANVSRQKEIYLMAANYLQALNWHSDAEIMNSITTFYKKAQAHDHLSAFFEACAQIEVDEYRDYEKGLQAMREAVRHAAKSKSADREDRLASLNQRISMAEAFVRAKQLIGASPQQALDICDNLLAQMPHDGNEAEPGIRMGDVYALMVEYWFDAGSLEEAYALVARMQDRGIVLTPYLDQQMLEAIFKAAGIQWSPQMGGGMQHQHQQQMYQNHHQQDDEDFVEEELPMDDDD